MNKKVCCFLGHRKIKITEELKKKAYSIVERLIVDKNIDTFLFGSKSQFNDLCYQVVSELKREYPHIKRVYIRAQFPYIDRNYKDYLLQHYEETYYPDHMIRAGKSAYVERNYEMINQSEYCVMYFDENYMPPRRKKRNAAVADYQPKSGTKIAYDYAQKKGKRMINVFNKTDQI